MRTTTENAQLALLLEVSGTPKPGNVDRVREYPDLRFEHFLAGAVGAREGLAMAADGAPVGAAFVRAVEGMSGQSGGNTQFGALLLVTPLVCAAADGALSPESADAVVDATTVEDAADFFRSFEHVEVAVDDPPASMEPLDVRRGAEAVPAVRERGITLGELMADSADRDGIAAEWTDGFPRTFAAAERLQSLDGPVTDRAATVYLDELASTVDTFVVTQHDRETAEEVRQRAAVVRDGDEDVEAFAEELVDREVNPGTTADVVAGALFVALERGMEV
ncbi:MULTISPECIES: triphosphoribosyl-dephospho-CoA synthase [Salinibaculum]|uniref:triphosphoribosyl-dephospho-CoA synthase n=1 Tax=Salinibaculum TaxID=2732368 RepID=UPI0030D2B89B